MITPKINWIPFDKDNPPKDLVINADYLIFFREDNYDDGATWNYHIDVATPYGDYLSNFWDTRYDWYEGQIIEVLAYADINCDMEIEERYIVEAKACDFNSKGLKDSIILNDFFKGDE